MNEENNLNPTPNTNVEPVQQPVTPVQPQLSPEALLEKRVAEMEQEMMKEKFEVPAEHVEEHEGELPKVEEQVVQQPVQQPVVQQPVEPQIDPSFGTNVQPPIQPVPEPTKKKSKLPIILVVLVILCGGAFAVWKFVLPKVLSNTDTETTTTTVADKVEELTDSSIKATIDKAIKFYETDVISLRALGIYESETFKIEDEKVKVDLAINNTAKITDESVIEEYKKKEKTFSPEAIEYLTGLQRLGKDENGITTVDADDYIKGEDVAKVYKEMFNTEMNKIELVSTCPTWLYDSANDMYVEASACGGDDGIEPLSYTYKYEKETKSGKEFYYGYVAVGYYKEDVEEGSYLYYSYMHPEIRDTLDNVEAKIDSTTYNRFDNFKYVFVKDATTGNIYVDHIELVK